MHCSIHNKTSKIVKMNFFWIFAQNLQKGGKNFDALDVLYTYWEKRKALFVVRWRACVYLLYVELVKRF